MGVPIHQQRAYLSVRRSFHSVHTLPSERGPVFSCHPEMRRAPHLSTKNRASASLLLRTPGPGRQRPLSNSSSFGAGASTYLRRTDRLTGSMLRLVTFSPLHLLYSTFVHFMLPPSLSLCLRPPPPFLALTLRGFTYTVRAQTVAQFTRTGPGLWTLKWGCVCNSAGRGCELLLLPQKTLHECGSETEGGWVAFVFLKPHSGSCHCKNGLFTSRS